MDILDDFFVRTSAIVWGPVLIILLFGCGLFYTIILRFIQIRKFWHGLKAISGFYDSPEHKGEISHFQALVTALSATIGVGNIAGVATAIAIGGPGAVVWMWLTGILGMATKFASCTLGHKFRIFKDGKPRGGPMYYIEQGLKNKFLAIFFAICCAISALGIGNMVQANSVADAFKTVFKVPPSITGIVLTFTAWLVIVGGIRRIARFAQMVVPFMCLFYVGTGLFILFRNISFLPQALKEIFKSAFCGSSAVGGFTGATVLKTMRIGTARGLFSNEAGLGSAPIAHSVAKTDEHVREGLVAMVGPFIDTIVVCSITALVIIASGLWQKGLTGATLTSNAFNYFLPHIGNYIVAVGLIFFAFSTLIGWSYYGETAVDYLLGPNVVSVYRWIYCFIIFFGAMLKLDLVWNISDTANGLMAFPNLLALFLLWKMVFLETDDYFKRHKC